MRKHTLGAGMPKHGWSPQYAVKSLAAELVEKQDKPKVSTIMSWQPSWRGPHRMVPLCRFSHIPMAMLLEADPHVDFWYSNIPSDPGAMEIVEDADFVAHSGEDRIAYRIKRAPSPAPEVSDAKNAFMAMASDRRIVLPASAVLADPRLPVARDILRVRSLLITKDLGEKASELASDPNGPKTLGLLRGMLGASEISWDLIKAIIGHGYVKVHLADSLEPSTPITGHRLAGWPS